MNTPDLPAYPTLGEIITIMADTAGLAEKTYDPTKGFRKKLERLRRQELDGCNLDNYRDVLWTIINRYEEVTKRCDFHWIAGSQIFHYFDAYQQLVLFTPVLGYSQRTISDFVSLHMLYWTTLRFFWWKENSYRDSRAYAEPWWLNKPNPQSGLGTLFKNLKRILGNIDMSWWELVKKINGSEPMQKEVHTERVKQISKWLSGTEPQFATIAEHIIDPLRLQGGVYKKAADIFEADFCGWRWISSWLKKLSLTEEFVIIFFQIILKEIPENVSVIDTSIPSDSMLLSGSIAASLNKSISFILGTLHVAEALEFVDLEIYDKWVKGIGGEGALKSDDVVDLIRFYEYRARDPYLFYTRQILESEDSENPYFQHVFKNRFYNGLIISGHRDAKEWLFFQQNNTPNLKEKRVSPLLLTGEDLHWLHSWTSKDINSQKTFRGFNRTRLMIAAYRGELELVKNLLGDGADPSILSKNSRRGWGDDVSALLFALMAFDAPMLPKQQQNSGKIVMMIINTLLDLPRETQIRAVTATHRITRQTPLSICIGLGQQVLVSQLLKLGADAIKPQGGDDLPPVYDAVSASTRWKKVADLETLLNLPENANVNTTRWENSLEDFKYLIAMIPADERIRFEKDIQKVMFHHQKTELKPYLHIIKLLVNYGADLNQLTEKGRYPLDMALEVGNKVLIDYLNKLGAFKRAIF